MPKNKQIAIIVKGIVQGVGFRPFVYNLANYLGLNGVVVNSTQGVEIHVFGCTGDLDSFVKTIRHAPPTLATVDSLEIRRTGEQHIPDRFVIGESDSNGRDSTVISPDAATCDKCLEDIFSTQTRRYLYPFTNCTNCGPRLTITRQTPYDRPHTSMAAFPMCPDCEREYADPADRRFHAQPNACPKCGPGLSWLDRTGKKIEHNNEECLFRCAQALSDGKIVAIKGLGGFHLVVDAGSDAAVQRLRTKKQRPGKPMAVMVPTVAEAEKIGIFNKQERELLLDRSRPIVLVRKQVNTGTLSQQIADGCSELGIMLPYTPLHHLLFFMPDSPERLVMTSGNLSSEPLCIDNREALTRLDSIADYFLLHNRDIVTRVDDSVARICNGKVQMIRRSRGYVPRPIAVKGARSGILACGAEQKNSFCLSRSGQAFLSQHIGDLKGPDNMLFFEETVCYMQNMLEIVPKVVACDLHPDYLSSRYAGALNVPCIRIQHHHAHAAAIMAEHGLEEGIAVLFDGAGLGDDGTIWGGEFFHVKGAGYERLGHLAQFQLPGGDLAGREIWRLGIALLAGTGVDISDPSVLPKALCETPGELLSGIRQMMVLGINAPQTSSVGRLFDGVAALLGLRLEVDFEGQAAMELETLAWDAYERTDFIPASSRYFATIKQNKDNLLLDYRPLVYWLLEDLESGVPITEIAFYFHLWLVRSTIKSLLRFSVKYPATNNVLLGGGCFQNRLLLRLLRRRLKENDCTMYTGEQVPVNDGGIALGQLYIVNKKLTEGKENVPCHTHAGC